MQVECLPTVGGIILWGALGAAAAFPVWADVSPKISWLMLQLMGKLLCEVVLDACTGFAI